MNAAEEADFVDFVRATSPQLFRTAWLLTGSRHAAEELVQDVLERCCMKWRSIRTDEAPAYARRILVNRHTDVWRRHRREVLTDELPERGAPAADPHHVDLVRALGRLTPRERQIVVLRYYADRSEREIADLLGISVGTVKSTGSRAAATLRAILAEGEISV